MIRTERLTITPLTYKELLRYVFGRKGSVITDEDEALMIEMAVEPCKKMEGQDYLYHTIWVARNDEDELVAEIRLKGLPTIFGLVEFADYVVPEFRGKGYCTEMVGGFFKWIAKNEMVNFIVASVEENNIASKKVLFKNGLKPIGYNEGRCTFILQLKF